MKLPNKISNTTNQQTLINTINDLIDYCKSLTPNGTNGVKVQRSIGGTNISLINNNQGVNSNDDSTNKPSTHPFKISIYYENSIKKYKVKTGIVNNTYTITEQTGTISTSPIFFCIVSDFTINNDGSLTPTGSSFSTAYTPTTKSIDVSSSTVSIYVFLGEYKVENNIETVNQWIINNFSCSAAGPNQKLIWYS